MIHGFLRDHIPLKQGLRHQTLGGIHHSHQTQRPYSIKTRIKTPDTISSLPSAAMASETIFH